MGAVDEPGSNRRGTHALTSRRRLCPQSDESPERTDDSFSSVVHAILNPEIARLIQRIPSGSTSYQLFQGFDDQIIAGEARQVLRDNIGVAFCIYMLLPGPKLPGS